MGSTSLDSRVLSSAELRVSGESMEKGVITADVATHEEVTESRELFAGERDNILSSAHCLQAQNNLAI